ncbi:MAG: acyl-CoA dehydratase activase [candidate division KSB1 bacterium]|nr:acyl-CoA dehydratase activase [candidate division KSB1 bacterium]
MPDLRIGLDVGSVNAKAVVICEKNTIPNALVNGWREYRFGENLFLYAQEPVRGNPQKAARILFDSIADMFPKDEFKITVTGSQGVQIAHVLDLNVLNEFKAIAAGALELFPDVKTILEIGGDGSRFLKVHRNPGTGQVRILDYERNGDCAAGTGSFIDQQALRLRYNVKEIGDLVATAETGASIAGRCSVFAKSDMIHAQQRGYSPAVIFKGLCQAVVRNFKGTVLRGKTLEPRVAFVGGVAANDGVVQAVKDICGLSTDELIVPDLHTFVGALGCALNAGEKGVSRGRWARLEALTDFEENTSYPALQLEQVQYIEAPQPDAIRPIEKLNAFLGVDIGSVSTNLVLIDETGCVLDEIYTATQGRPVDVVKRELLRLARRWQDQIQIEGVGTTGSGRELIGELIGADVIHDEITAHKTGATHIATTYLDGNVDTIFEIGGQDSKFISIDDGIVVDFTMNEACAAGTGSFLEEQADKLGISIEQQFADYALSSDRPLRLGERCTVFMEKDVSAYMQKGHAVKEITAGLAFAVVQNYLNRVVRGRKIGDSIFFQGGTAYNKAVAAAFATTLGKPIIVPPHNGVMGAIGAALLARDKINLTQVRSRFRGFDLNQVDFDIRHFVCKGCTNHCNIQQITIEGEKTFWGDKCSNRFRTCRKAELQPTIPDLFAAYREWLVEELPGPDGLDTKIGVPRTFFYYDRFPFWKTFFRQLGAEIVLSEPTNNEIISAGRELCIAEPCFPVVVAHGHIATLFDKDVDFIFAPVSVNSEAQTPDVFSWYCPWGQTFPLVTMNAGSPDMRDKMLSPVLRFRYGPDFIKKQLYPVAERLGVSRRRCGKAVDFAYDAQRMFKKRVKETGKTVLDRIVKNNESAVVIVGRPYNIYDNGVNLSIPDKLREQYGINIIPMDFLPIENINVSDVHENMFWTYGYRILQAAKFTGQHDNLHLIYLTNFKCGPDSYIKHFVRDALGSPYLTLQFDGHGNDAGILTRCEAFLQSKHVLGQSREKIKSLV